jgi:putative FmdB family regulatory protein
MPIYEYECRACGHSFDVLQKITDGALRKCPECGALKLQRLVSAPQFRLKGTGWYETDFKKDGRKRVLGAGDATDAGKDGAGDTAQADKGGKADKPAADSKDKADKKPARVGKPGKPAAAAD